MKKPGSLEGIDAYGCCQHRSLIAESGRDLSSGVHNSVFGGIPLGSAFPAMGCDSPCIVNGVLEANDKGSLQGKA